MWKIIVYVEMIVFWIWCKFISNKKIQSSIKRQYKTIFNQISSISSFLVLFSFLFTSTITYKVNFSNHPVDGVVWVHQIIVCLAKARFSSYLLSKLIIVSFNKQDRNWISKKGNWRNWFAHQKWTVKATTSSNWQI